MKIGDVSCIIYLPHLYLPSLASEPAPNLHSDAGRSSDDDVVVAVDDDDDDDGEESQSVSQ